MLRVDSVGRGMWRWSCTVCGRRQILTSHADALRVGIAHEHIPAPKEETQTMFSKQFWKLATERAVKTAAQSAILVFGADQVNALRADWADVGGFALGGLVLSYLFSLASSQVGGDTTPSLVEQRPVTQGHVPARDGEV